MKNVRTLKCSCGQVALSVTDKPIVTVACYCDDCQKAAEKLSTLPNAGSHSILEDDSSTHFVLYRKDKVACVNGAEQLAEFRLKADSPTRRIIATCCNTAMYLEFENGHWLSLYKNRFVLAEQPEIEQRTMTKYKRPDVTLSEDIPSPPSHTFSFIRKLVFAWVAMGFRKPKAIHVSREIDV